MADEQEELQAEETVAEEVVEQVEEATTEEVVEEVVEEQPGEEVVTDKTLPKGVVRRLAKMARQKGDLQRENDVLRYQAQNPQPAQPSNTDRPEPEDFEDDYEGTKFIDALTDWKVNQKFSEHQQQTVETQRQTQQNQVVAEFEEKVSTTVDKGVAAYDDFEEVAVDNPNLFITTHMANVIGDSDIGHDIAYYLGDNTDESVRIAKLAPMKQVEAIVRLEIKLATQPKKKVSKAPEPIKPVGGKGATSTELDPSKDYKKWAEARNREEFGR